MLKNGKYDSKDKSVLFLFLSYLKKIHNFGDPKHSFVFFKPNCGTMSKFF
jgi:hypothetical protein